MSAQTKVAVVVRTKNRPLLLQRALADIFAQSFTDVTVVVVNDGGSAAPVDALAKEYAHLGESTLQVIHHEQSVGMEAASNVGIHATDSEFLVIHDDDDKWHPDFLATCVQHLADRPRLNGLSVRTQINYEEISDQEITEVGTSPFWPELKQISLSDMLTVNRFVPISFMYRRRVHEQIGMYNEDLAAVGDWEFYLRFLQRFPIELLDGEPLAYWCHRPEAGGDMGNSIIEASADHTKFDRLVRDDYLRQDMGETGIGPMLYLAEIASKQERAIDELKHLNHLLMQRLDMIEETFVRRTSFTDVAQRPARMMEKIKTGLRKGAN